MCATGMESADEELSAVLQNHQNPTDVSLVGVVSSSSTVASSSLAAGSGGRDFPEGQHSFSPERPAMLGPGTTRPYSDSSGSKPSNMSVQTMNPFQEQAGHSFGLAAPMPPKNGIRRQGLWSSGNRNFMSGRNGEPEMDTRLQVSDYSPAVLDQSPVPIPDPFRASGGLARYHSAPSSFLAGLAADFQQDSALSSFFSDAELPPLNTASDSSLDNMDTEQSSTSLFDDKFMLDTRKFERIRSPQLSSGGGGGLVSQKPLQSTYKHSMEILHENSSVPPRVPAQMTSSAQMSASSQMPSSMSPSLCMPVTMGLVQQVSNIQTGQQMNLGNLSGNMNFTGGLSSEFGGGVPSGTLGGLPSSGGANSLLRQSSSPAGLLAQLSIDAQPQLTKNERQTLSSPRAHSPEDSLSGGTSEDNSGTHGMMSGIDVGGWEDVANSYMKSWGNDTFSARKRIRDNMDLGDIMLPSESSGHVDHGPVPGSLTRHMSLPTSKSRAGVSPDDLMQSVPCRIRAKRGCATHPRSIAERVRRTRISERMRKLQELVPNMDKQQTNTADMLDEAVEYVKQLQRQVQELTESQEKCNGSCHQDHKNSAS